MVAAQTKQAWQEKLDQRGILSAALEAGWHDFTWFNTPGWAYPLYQANGSQWTLGADAGVAAGRLAQRWKAMDSAHTPKYLWGYPDQSRDRADVRQPKGCQYYWLPGGVQPHIAAANGTLIVACGEPDTLTFASAGMRNVVSFFGEGQIPENAAVVFTTLGVKRIVYYPDNDHTGWDDAIKLIEAFKGTPIVVEVYALPAEYDAVTVNDINDLWGACDFDVNVFAQALTNAKLLNDALRPVENAQQNAAADALWQAEIDRYNKAVEDALTADGAVWKRAGSWSKQRCIFATHEHDDTPKDWQAGFNREKGQFRCFKCAKTWGRDAVADHYGIERPKAPPRANGAKPANGTAAAPAPVIPIYSSMDALTRYRERLEGRNPIQAIPFPFKAMHKFDGYCRVVALGKVIGILGLSGGGKTSMMETMCDAWRQMGYHILEWSPEWTWEEKADRTVQRYGGATFTDMMLHELWLSEEKAGVPAAARIGVRMEDDMLNKTLHVVGGIERWQGQAYYVDKMGVTLDVILDAMQQKLDALTAQGKRPSIAVFDYIQLADIAGARGDGERIPRAISLIKSFVSDNRLVGLVGTQARKDDSEKARADGELLTAEAAQYFRDDKTNLFLTLNPTFDSEGNMTNRGAINIVKNSGGKRGVLAARPNPRYLRWDDVEPTRVNTNAHLDALVDL